MTAIRLSPRLWGGGVGRRLCMPTYHGLSDGPWRDSKFHVSVVRHDFQNVLISGDCKKLVLTAEELLQVKPQAHQKGISFWEIYSKRVKSSVHLLSPFEMALVARSFYHHGKDTGIFSVLAIEAKRRARELDGFSLRTMAEIISRRLRRGSQTTVLQALLWRLPSVTFQLSAVDTGRFLLDVARGGVMDAKSCHLAARKFLRDIPSMTAPALGTVARAFAAHECGHSEVYEAVLLRALELKGEMDQKAFIRLSRGFAESGLAQRHRLRLLLLAVRERLSEVKVAPLSCPATVSPDGSQRSLEPGPGTKEQSWQFSDFELSVVLQALEKALMESSGRRYDAAAKSTPRSSCEEEPSSGGRRHNRLSGPSLVADVSDSDSTCLRELHTRLLNLR